MRKEEYEMYFDELRIQSLENSIRLLIHRRKVLIEKRDAAFDPIYTGTYNKYGSLVHAMSRVIDDLEKELLDLRLEIKCEG